MPANVLVIVVDGLRASALGAYGNTSFATPALDRFAAESLLFDWAYASAVDLKYIYHSLWCSRNRIENAAALSLPRVFASAGYATALVTDDPSLHSLAPPRISTKSCKSQTLRTRCRVNAGPTQRKRISLKRL